MHYNKIITLKNSAVCTLRNADFDDGAAVLDVFLLTHAQTDNLLSYPDENTFTANDEAMYLKEKSDSADEIEILAEIDGKVVGTAGISKIGKHSKVKHRAEFGIGIDQKYWGLGIGKALTMFANARNAGIILGAKVPIVLVSRADSADSKLASIALGSVLSARMKLD